jgi:hypothetical protein
MAAGEFFPFVADGQDGAGGEHLNFRLSAALGSVALFDPALRVIDYVIYTPQKIGVSMGRCPDGGVTNVAQTVRTPGAPNYCPTPPPPPPDPILVNLLPLASVWRYNTKDVAPEIRQRLDKVVKARVGQDKIYKVSIRAMERMDLK